MYYYTQLLSKKRITVLKTIILSDSMQTKNQLFHPYLVIFSIRFQQLM